MRRPSSFYSSFALLLALLGALTGFEPSLFARQAPAVSPDSPSAAPVPADQALSIIVIAGEDGVNIVKRRTAVAPVVEVRDRNHVPVAGAVVNFSSPNRSPGVTFMNGSRTFSAVTETNGRAAAPGLLPVGIGVFQISVTASYDGMTAYASVEQTNYENAADAESAGHDVPAQTVTAKTNNHSVSSGKGLSGGAIAGIVAGVAGAVAIGLVLGLRHSGNSSSGTTIGVGNPTVGAPH